MHRTSARRRSSRWASRKRPRPGRARVHERHGRRRVSPGRRRGVPVADADRRAHRRPAAAPPRDAAPTRRSTRPTFTGDTRAPTSSPVPANAADVGRGTTPGSERSRPRSARPPGPFTSTARSTNRSFRRACSVATPPLREDETGTPGPRYRRGRGARVARGLRGDLRRPSGGDHAGIAPSATDPVAAQPRLATRVAGARRTAQRVATRRRGAGRALAAAAADRRPRMAGGHRPRRRVAGGRGSDDAHDPDLRRRIIARGVGSRNHLDPARSNGRAADPRRPGAVRGGRLGQARRGPAGRAGGCSRYGGRRTCSCAPRSIACSTLGPNRSRVAWRATWRRSSPTRRPLHRIIEPRPRPGHVHGAATPPARVDRT
jgi:hypothetical protein